MIRHAGPLHALLCSAVRVRWIMRLPFSVYYGFVASASDWALLI